MDAKVKELDTFISRLILALTLAKNALSDDATGYLLDEASTREALPVVDHSVTTPYDRGGAEDAHLSLRRLIREPLISEIRRERLLTNDIVELHTRTRELRINGSDPIRLKAREFFFLLVLARHRQSGGGYLPVTEIIARIKEEKLAQKGNESLWSRPNADDLYRAVKELRSKILNAGGNAKLVQSARYRGNGYRLSTPSLNIDIISGAGDDGFEFTDIGSGSSC